MHTSQFLFLICSVIYHPCWPRIIAMTMVAHLQGVERLGVSGSVDAGGLFWLEPGSDVAPGESGVATRHR